MSWEQHGKYKYYFRGHARDRLPDVWMSESYGVCLGHTPGSRQSLLLQHVFLAKSLEVVDNTWWHTVCRSDPVPQKNGPRPPVLQIIIGTSA